jgi:hypothetical protein
MERPGIDNAFSCMLVVGKCGYLTMMWGIVIAKDKSAIGGLVMV